ncbi:hypothetical protein Q4E93_15095 [Flavitalea sp. BT771]|uniref:hypothetical protein n=1 Tax=Flavitalea sp. BT771 TaxID=3063329 RepID=UPI0026E2D7D4|nr:hypothetical protein [Flavitalea sp. BT771]MDO6431931.1 hypothetical protein [Flavitalea sp. BT771]MDV6220840.1 hypothetical protein [Flavitalea sp. BT771]
MLKRPLFFIYSIIVLLVFACSSAPDIKEKATAGPSGRDVLRALGRSCDTTYAFIDDSLEFDHDTGYVVDAPYDEPYLDDHEHRRLTKGKWEIATYKQTGPESYVKDEKKKLPLYLPVRIVHSYIGEAKKSLHGWRGHLLVAPVGSEERFVINVDNFTLKEVRQCDLEQKARNHFCAKATYVPSPDEGKRPLSTGYDEQSIEVPTGATLIIAGYDAERKLIRAGIYNKSGQFVGDGQFYEGTLVAAN